MTTDILPSQIIIASNGKQVFVRAVLPRPNFIMLFLAVLLGWTIVALAMTGLGSLVSLCFLSASWGLTGVILYNEITKLREQEVYNDYSY